MAIVVRKPGVVARARLRSVLHSLLVKAPTEAQDHKFLLETIEALDALAYGELRPIFIPRKTHAKGKMPFTERKLRMRALGFVDLLRKNGFSDKEACAKVGLAFFVGRSTVRKWRNRIGKTTDPLMQLARSEVATCTHWNEAELEMELARSGKRHSIAKKKKTKPQK